MKHLYLFNPENDLALAAGSSSFTPPAAALRLAASGAGLPMWYASRGDYVLADDTHRPYFESLGEMFNFPASIVGRSPESGIDRCVPWGWSAYASRLLHDAGCADCALPDSLFIDNVRRLSHRRISIEVYRHLHALAKALPYPLPPVPVEVRDIAEIQKRLAVGDHLFLKSPLSGSGRGILDTATAPVRQILRLASGVIRHQGSIVMEQALDKRCDFAMLFDMIDGRARFVGYSCFFNAGYSAYAGNLLMPDEDLAAFICSHGVDRQWLDATRDAVGETLTRLVGTGYSGALGVDMMVYTDGRLGCPSIAPCVEVNLRMTMGRVAHSFTQRYLYPDAKGIMSIRHGSGLPQCQPAPVVSDSRLVDGTLSLTTPGFPFAVMVQVGEDA